MDSLTISISQLISLIVLTKKRHQKKARRARALPNAVPSSAMSSL
jgi:hypothetical protein